MSYVDPETLDDRPVHPQERLYDGNYDAGAVREKEIEREVKDDKASNTETDIKEVDLEEDSPYAEVRAAVSNTDDPSLPVNTFRTWLLGCIWAIILPGVNQFFFFRYPSVSVPSLVAQLLTWPVGMLMHEILPHHRFFNPGPFNIKEHTLITVMANVSAQSAYATDIIAVQRFFYDQRWSFGYQICLVVSTQCIGFSMGGLLRQFLVWPSAMIWPSTLINTSLFNTLHGVESEGDGRGGWSRQGMFGISTGASFIWSIFTTYLATFLQYFDWMTWIAPQNKILNQVTGYQSGMGLSLLTFDWGIISYIGVPMATPWWAAANIAGGFVVFVWCVAPAIYYSNVWYSAYLPFSSAVSYDRFGNSYKPTKILTDFVFDKAKYSDYSEIYLSSTFALAYGMSFASLTSILVHTFLYYRKSIWNQARRSLKDEEDIHAKLMAVYPEVPMWWYALTFLLNFALGFAAILAWPTGLPAWAYIISLIIAFVFALPIGIVQAITNQQVGLNVITEMIVGYMVPGRPVSMMIFKTYGYITMAQAMSFVSDLKLGHYMKIPPRLMFWGQCVATVIACFVQIGVQDWMFSNIPNMCDKSTSASNAFWCPSTQTFGSASIIWGVIGPARTFGPGAMFTNLNYFFLVGAIVPIPFYFLAKRYPNSMFKYINWPVIFSGTGLMPPALPINFISFCMVCFLFNYVIRRKAFAWWSKYNYIFAAGLSSGYAIGVILIFFCLQYPKNGTIGADSIQTWWGNTVYQNTADAEGVPYYGGADKGFGRPVGSW